MALGCLMIGLKSLNILKPPQPPYETFSVTDVLEGLENINLPHYCERKRTKGINYRSESEYCEGLKPRLIAKIQELEEKLGVRKSI